MGIASCLLAIGRSATKLHYIAEVALQGSSLEQASLSGLHLVTALNRQAGGVYQLHYRKYDNHKSKYLGCTHGPRPRQPGQSYLRTSASHTFDPFLDWGGRSTDPLEWHSTHCISLHPGALAQVLVLNNATSQTTRLESTSRKPSSTTSNVLPACENCLRNPESRGQISEALKL